MRGRGVTDATQWETSLKAKQVEFLWKQFGKTPKKWKQLVNGGIFHRCQWWPDSLQCFSSVFSQPSLSFYSPSGFQSSTCFCWRNPLQQNPSFKLTSPPLQQVLIPVPATLPSGCRQSCTTPPGGQTMHRPQLGTLERAPHPLPTARNKAATSLPTTPTSPLLPNSMPSYSIRGTCSTSQARQSPGWDPETSATSSSPWSRPPTVPTSPPGKSKSWATSSTILSLSGCLNSNSCHTSFQAGLKYLVSIWEGQSSSLRNSRVPEPWRGGVVNTYLIILLLNAIETFIFSHRKRRQLPWKRRIFLGLCSGSLPTVGRTAGGRSTSSSSASSSRSPLLESVPPRLAFNF